MRTAIFDLDGTLADTSLDLLAAGNACFDAPILSAETDRATAFNGGRAMLRLGFARQGRTWSEADVEEGYPRLLAAYEGALSRHTTLFPGVLETLDLLAEEGWRLGVCTLKPAYLAEALLTDLGVRDRFHALLGQDSLPVKKPDPRHLIETVRQAGGDPARSVLVGDSTTDRETARAAGAPSILVTFRPAGIDVAALAPEALLERYEDLPSILERLVP
ncbi:MAG: HAD hydrolase-like protein [Pseudomonadota bacterium]